MKQTQTENVEYNIITQTLKHDHHHQQQQYRVIRGS